MSLRTRVAGLVALAVALAFLLASLAMFGVTRRSLLAAVDDELREAVELDRRDGTQPAGLVALRDVLDERRNGGGPGRGGPGSRPGRPRIGGASGDALRGLGLAQLVNRAGTVLITLPADSEALPVATDQLEAAFTNGTSDIGTVRTDDASYRVVTAAVAPQAAVQLARPIDDIERGLSRLVVGLALVSVVGIGLAFLAGGLVADRILRPVRRLTDTAELIAETQELEHRAEVEGDDELARLAASLNGMLTALDRSRQAQQQLVADASHELRTPLTSLRTNIELLGSADRLAATDRDNLRADVIAQIDEMTVLIGNLVDLARDGSSTGELGQVRLDEVVATVVDRQRRLAPSVDLRADLPEGEVVVRGEEERLSRAVANLVDNAIKYAGQDGPIEVSLMIPGDAAPGQAAVRVRDHGPGIADEDRGRVFDRFWRSPTARSAPGSGLGLSIVAQVAEQHGGSVDVANHHDGGAVFTLELPTA